MTVMEIYTGYFQAIADALFPVAEGSKKKNLVEVSEASEQNEMQLFNAASGFSDKFIIIERPDNSFLKNSSRSITEISGCLFVMGFVDKVKYGQKETKDMTNACEQLCLQIFDTMVYDSEQIEGRILYNAGIVCKTEAPGNWAAMMNKYWGYRIEFTWTLHQNLYNSEPIIEHGFTTE